MKNNTVAGNESVSGGNVVPFSGGIIDTIEHLFIQTCLFETELHTHITMHTPGRTYTKLRNFATCFGYMFTLSSGRKEINTELKQKVQAWLDCSPIDRENDKIDTNHIRAGVALYSQYTAELFDTGILQYKT